MRRRLFRPDFAGRVLGMVTMPGAVVFGLWFVRLSVGVRVGNGGVNEDVVGAVARRARERR